MMGMSGTIAVTGRSLGAAGNIKTVAVQAAAAGASGLVADAEHLHPLTGGASPAALAFNNTASAGTGANPARDDHRHAIPHVETKASPQLVGTTTYTWTFAATFGTAPVVVVSLGPPGGAGVDAYVSSISATAAVLLTSAINHFLQIMAIGAT